MMSAAQHSSTAARMRMAQLRKNASGRIRITGSVAGSKSQLSLPGKKMLWNTVKARSKSRAARTPTMASAPPRPQPAQKPGLWPARGSRVRPFFRRRAYSTSSTAMHTASTRRSSRNSRRTSAKWLAPSGEKDSTPAAKSGRLPRQ